MRISGWGNPLPSVPSQVYFSVVAVLALVQASHAAPQAPAGGAPSVVAGKVTKEIPKGTVEHQGKASPLSLNSAVDWDDTVQTLDKGRLQITLTDGSVLTVGIRSQMKIVKSDAAAQQTDIELVGGTIKADVQKVTKSGGHFQIRTKTAVIGVVGTNLFAKAEDKGTTVCNVTKSANGGNGSAEVIVTDLAGAQTRTVKSGYCAFFPLLGLPVALSVAASVSAAAGMGTATAFGTAAAVSAGVVAAGATAAASAATVGGLAASGALSGGSSVSPSQ